MLISIHKRTTKLKGYQDGPVLLDTKPISLADLKAALARVTRKRFRIASLDLEVDGLQMNVTLDIKVNKVEVV